jgi:hypothetical protein
MFYLSTENSSIGCNDALVNEAMTMDNSGSGPLRVPGFGGIPIEHVLKCEDRFAHGTKDWQQAPAVTAREFAMVAVMNTLTDKPEWHVNIFNDQIVANWREEAFATTPLVTKQSNSAKANMFVCWIQDPVSANPTRSFQNLSALCLDLELRPYSSGRTRIGNLNLTNGY